MSSDRNILLLFAIGLFGFLAFTQVTFLPVALYYSGLLFLTTMLVVFFVLLRLKIEVRLVGYFSLFLSCFLVGVLSYPVSMNIETRFDYSELDVLGRILNLTLLFIVFIAINSFHRRACRSYCDRFLVVRFYYLGIFAVLLVGVWQFISFYSFISFPFETRSKLHSTYGSDYSFSGRLTSIAREPSYFVMLAIDFIGLSLLFCSGAKRVLMVFLGATMVVFSLSPSGFISLFGAVAAAWFFSEVKYFSGRVSSKKIVFFIFSMFAAALFFVTNEQVFQYVYGRIFDASLSNSARFYMVVMPYVWSFDGNFFSFLFGYGVKSYSIIGGYYSLPSGVPVHPTSNNIYTDIFWESGLVGLVLLILFFVFSFVSIFKCKVGKWYSFIAFYFLFELMLSGMFRADYASARFFIILYVIYLLTNQPLGRGVNNECRSASA